ncbi:MAG: FKBP-type peptidyl-prolyl cis-trans isomerase, partial [Candidatus Thorarchaeota archaeon]
GNDIVSVHYKLFDRNGTLLQEGDAPNDDSTIPIEDERLLQSYIDEIIGMRIGEERHFVIPAEKGYTTTGHELYGQNLEYTITLTRIGLNTDNPADASQIVYRDDHAIGTFQHLPDANQSRIVAANGSDDGTTTQLEYFIRMNSTDPNDIPLFNATDVQYPFILMLGDSENFDELPVQHTDWTNPLMVELVPDTAPSIVVESPTQNETLGLVAEFKINVTDNTYVRTAHYRIDDENWTQIFHNFESDLWEVNVDLSEFEIGNHQVWFNATDASNVTSTTSVNVTFDWPFAPLIGMRLDVKRSFVTRLYHNTKIDDQYTVRNNGTAPIGALEFFLPQPWSGYFLSVSAEDSFENELEIVQLDDFSGMMHFRVYFVTPVGFQDTLTFTTTMMMHSLHTLVDGNTYNVSYLLYPTVPYVMKTATMKVSFRSGDSIQGAIPDTDDINVAPMSIEEFDFSLRSFTPLIAAERTTQIVVDAWGWLSYSETIHVENIGPARESYFAFTIPAYAADLRIYDEVGTLAESMPREELMFNNTIEVRIDLKSDRWGDDGFWPGYSYTFWIDFVIQASSYSDAVASGSKLKVPMATLGEIVFPISTNLVETSGDYLLVHGVFDTSITYTVYNTTLENPPSIVLVYQVSVGAAARPLLFALIVGFIAAIYVMYRKVDLPDEFVGSGEEELTATENQATGAPPELLREFATLYSKKTTLNMDLEKVESSRRRGKLKKREFMIRQKDVKSQMEKIDSQLPSIKDKLVSEGPRYRDIVAQLELHEERIEGAKAGLRQLLLRKKKQRISRAAFEKARQDYLKVIKKGTSATDRILLSIQEEAGDI